MSQPPWEARSEITNSSVGKRNGITSRRGSWILARHQNWCEFVNSVKDRIAENGGAEL